jgi:hypothetical protein
MVEFLSGYFERETGLASSTCSRQRDEPMPPKRR